MADPEGSQAALLLERIVTAAGGSELAGSLRRGLEHARQEAAGAVVTGVEESAVAAWELTKW